MKCEGRGAYRVFIRGVNEAADGGSVVDFDQCR